MRGKFIPEEVRSTVMNIFRIGLNLIVVLVLWNVRTVTSSVRCRRLLLSYLCAWLPGVCGARVMTRRPKRHALWRRIDAAGRLLCFVDVCPILVCTGLFYIIF